MKTLKRFFILLMVAVMLMTTFLTACADPAGPNDQETTPPAGDAGDVTTPAEGGEVTTPVRKHIQTYRQADRNLIIFIVNSYFPSKTSKEIPD